MDLGVELLEDGPRHRLKILLGPVDLELPGDRVHEALVSLEHLARAGDAPHREKGGVGGAERGGRVGQPFPVRELAGAGDAERVERGPGDRDRVGAALLIEPQRARDAGGHGIGPLRGVVKALRPDRSDLGETILHLVGDR